MKRAKAPSEKRPGELCLSCGLCCNGTIFGDVNLLAEDDAGALRSLGMPLLKTSPKGHSARTLGQQGWRFLQPCAAFDGCRCRIYPSRPSYCRDFECLLLKKVTSGLIPKAQALDIIRAARRQAETVADLLRALGHRDEEMALADRFRQTAKTSERGPLVPAEAELFGRLTIAFHELTLTLNEQFYPAGGASEH